MESLEELSSNQSFCHISSDHGCISESLFNGYEVLLVATVALIFSFHRSITSKVSNWAKSFVKPKASPEVLRLGSEVKRLKGELAHLSPTSEFSAYFKTERVLNKTIEQYDAAVSEDNKKQSSPAKVDLVVRILSQAVALALLHIVSGIYALCIPSAALWPFNVILRFPSVWSAEVCEGAGVPYAPRSRFTPAEDEQIRKNWKRFAAKHNLEYGLAANYAGIPGFQAMFGSLEDRVNFNITTKFWPKMCRKLPHRSAQQVRTRMKVLFDPAILNGHAEVAYLKTHNWTLQETNKLLRYYRIYGLSASAIKLIGSLMKLPMHTCQNHLRSILERKGPVPDHLRKKLWVVVTKKTPAQNDRAFEKVVYKDIRKRRLEAENKYDDLIPWDTIAPKMVYSVEVVKDAWHYLLNLLQASYIREKETGKTSHESWTDALKTAFAVLPPISCEDYSRFLHILSEETPPDLMFDACSRKLYNWAYVRSRLEDEGVVGFYAGGHEEHEYLFLRTQKIMCRAHRLLFRRMKLPYTLKERMRILSLAYDYQCEFSPKLHGDNREDCAEAGDCDPPQRDRFKDLSLRRCGFPMLNRQPFVEALVVYSLSHFDDWIPPTALKKYVKSEDVLAMFPDGKDNSELIRPSDLVAMVSFLDLDVSSEASSSESEAESYTNAGNETEEEDAEKAHFRTNKESRKRRIPVPTDQKPGTSDEHSSATANGLGSPLTKQCKNDETLTGDPVSKTCNVSKVTDLKPAPGEGPDLETSDNQRSSHKKHRQADRTSHLEKEGIVDLLKALSPRKKKMS